MRNALDLRGRETRTLGAVFAATSGGVLILSRLLPFADDGPVLCLFRRVTGLPCPSCGMTRGFVALAHGDWQAALEHNLASPGVFAAAGVIFLLAMAQTLTDRRLLESVWRALRTPVFLATLALMAAAWLVNLARCFR